MNEQRFLDYLRARAAVDLPLDLVGQIAEAVSRTPQQRPRTWSAFALPAAAAAVTVLVLALAATGLLPPVGPAPSTTPSPVTSPSAAPTASATASVYVPDYDSFAEVAVESLPLYADQDLNEPIVGEAITLATGEGQLVYVTDREALPGWRRVEVRVSVEGASGWIFAWVPLEVDSRSTLRPASLAGCPTTEIASLAAWSPPEALNCFRSSALELSGWAQQADFGTGITGEPGWLTDAPAIGLMSVTPELGGPMIGVHLDPQAGTWPVGEEVVVTGHFDDPRSADCRRTGLPGAASETAEESALWCAQQFVIDSVRRVNPIPTPAPVTYRPSPGSPFTIIDHAGADALFTSVESCTNPVGQFMVEYPASWYTNPPIGELPACSWFAPTPFDAGGGGAAPADVAIVITILDGDFGFVTTPETTLWELVSIRGHEATRFEQVGMHYPAGGFERLPATYVYAANYGSSGTEGPSMLASTASEGADDYILNKAILDRMMASLVRFIP